MEQNQKIQIILNEGVDTSKPIEVVLREGDAPRAINPLPLKEPEKIDVTGIINTPLIWLEKRRETIDLKNANIKVSREKMSITLTIEERDVYLKSSIVGSVQFSEIFEKLGINDEKSAWIPSKLGQCLRLNRVIFTNKEDCMKIVSSLKNFSANVRANIEKVKDSSGSRAEVYRQEVESNLPSYFIVKLPIFKGTPKVEIQVEFDHYLDGSEVCLQLVSPAANEIIEEYRDRCIDEVLNSIRVIAPDIPIIEL